MKNIKIKMLVAAGLITSSGLAQAAVDVSTEVTAFQTDVSTGVAAIGGAMLVVAGIAVTYKWIKASFFG